MAEKRDANDYSKWDDMGLYDGDESPKPEESAELKETLQSIDEALASASISKDKGNAAFKLNDFSGANTHYEEGVKSLEKFKDGPPSLIPHQSEGLNSLLISLHGNVAMSALKEENWLKAANNATEVIKMDVGNVKAYYRRALANIKLDRHEEAKLDLLKCIELDSANSAAKKELVSLTKLMKDLKTKEKAAFSSMFTKGSIYDDKEKERLEKIKREEEEQERLKDEWSKSKLDRREKGLEEQTYEDWLKERKEAEEKEKKESESQKSKSPSKPINRKSPKKSTAPATDDDDYDEEEAKIIAETKAKGYCYFKKEQSVEEKALIGNIAPKLVTPSVESGSTADAQLDGAMSPAASTAAVASSGDNAPTTGGVTASSWNHAGTWEERDTTTTAKERLKELCLQASTSLPALDMSDPSALTAALSSMKTGLGAAGSSEDSLAGLSQFSSSMSAVRATVTDVKKLEGEAQIVMARGKKRHLYDFNMTLDFEIVLEPVQGMDGVEMGSSKAQKFKGSLDMSDVSPSVPVEQHLTFKKTLPAGVEKRVRQAAESLQAAVNAKIAEFETEYKAM